MDFWNQSPLCRLFISFSAGIIAAIFIEQIIPFQWYIMLGLMVIFIFIYSYKKLYIKYKYRFLFGIITDICLFSFAYILTILKTEKLDAEHFSKLYAAGDLAIVMLDDRPVEKEKTYKLNVRVLNLKKKDNWVNVSGHALIYLQKDQKNRDLEYGDVLIVKPMFKEVPPPQNPSEFNYKRYLGFHQIGWQSYLPTEKCMRTGLNIGNTLYYHAQHLRNAGLEVLRNHGMKENEFAVASALILGYKDALDDQIKQSYSSSGAMHVLAVSGLHVGIIFLILKSVLRFLERIKYGNTIKISIMIIFLWFYAALTGMSPSVMRASTMFTCILFGQAINRTATIYNTLAASAFILLLINPFLITEVGFQLSYLAVAGIVFIQPRLYHLITVNLWLLDKAWAITTVSIAAQIATFPLGLLYFHQFPNYFLFSNLLVIPMAAIILYNGMLVFALSFSDTLCDWACYVLDLLVKFLNMTVGWIEKLPYAITGGISISITETYIIYLSIILLLAFFVLTRARYLISAFLCFSGLMLFQIKETYSQRSQKEVVIYNIPGERAIDFINGRSDVLISDQSLIEDEGKMLFRIKHFWWEQGIDEFRHIVPDTKGAISTDALFYKFPFIQFKNKRFALIDRTFKNRKVKKRLKIDYLILSENVRVSIAELIKQFKISKIIFDSSNSFYSVKNWEAQANAFNIETFNISARGAYSIHL